MIPKPSDSDIESYVARYYDKNAENEWSRLERHPTEYAVTLRALQAYLPPAPAHILDCGGGPGRYALELTRQGYSVTLFDLAAGNLALAEQKAAEAGLALAALAQGNALDLTRFADDAFDAVLLMGPLYHLLERNERTQALCEATRVLKPGGVLFAAFLAPYAAHRDAAIRYPEEPLLNSALYEEIERSGRLLPRSPDATAFSAYFAQPAEVQTLCRAAGLEMLTLLGVEGHVGINETGGVNSLSGPAWEWWVEANWRVAADPAIHGAVEHLLAVARKPRWPRVLAALQQQAAAAGVQLMLTGGAGLAAQGMPVAVRDLDLLTDRAGAYRLSELWNAFAIQPVQYSENPPYRSHFGRFLFDGIGVDLMAELEWRTEDHWQPITSATSQTVTVAGVEILVPWAEEEFLAYIRRGRLERAAAILPHLDPQRLLQLLRGQPVAGMV